MTVLLHYFYTTYQYEIHRVFRNVGTKNSDAGKLPKRNNTTRINLNLAILTYIQLRPRCVDR
jgi:hypothetical protein